MPSSTQLVNNLPAVQETLVQFLGWEDALEKGKATHSSVLAWRIPWVQGVTKSWTRLNDFHTDAIGSVFTPVGLSKPHIGVCKNI